MANICKRDRLRVAVEAARDTKTVDRYLRGIRVSPNSRAAIESAMARLGISAASNSSPPPAAA